MNGNYKRKSGLLNLKCYRKILRIQQTKKVNSADIKNNWFIGSIMTEKLTTLAM